VERWTTLVRENKVQTLCNVGEDLVRYGLKLVDGLIVPFAIHDDTGERYLLPGESLQEETTGLDRVLQPGVPIHHRLLRNYRHIYNSSDPSVVKIQLKEVHLLLPKPHCKESCSLCNSKFALKYREPIAVYKSSFDREWEFHWNIAPVDRNGHFVVVPNPNLEENQREQMILHQDLEDIFEMVFRSTHVEAGNEGCFLYNSIGAGASQNHIHFQYLSSSVPLLQNNDTSNFGEILHLTQIGLLRVGLQVRVHGVECKCHFLRVLWDSIGLNSKTTLTKEQIKFISTQMNQLLDTVKTHKRPFNLLLNHSGLYIFPRLLEFTIFNKIYQVL
jgi:hypothetical protein